MSEVLRESVNICAPGRLLAGELAYAIDSQPAFAVLVTGPHPYMGGSMQNALVSAIAGHLALAGGVTLRFDYGGTGSSAGPAIDIAESMAAFWATGSAPEDPARLDDAAVALQFLESLGVRPLFLVGYSFGASAVWRMAAGAAAEIAGIVLISPTLTRHEFPPVPGAGPRRALIMHSDDDFCTPHARVEEWVRSLPGCAQYSCRAGGNHFFRGAEHEIARDVAGFVASLGNRPVEHLAC